MTKKQYQNATGIFSTQLAVGSFAIGTLLLILQVLLHNEILIEIGIYYVIIAIIVNLIMLLYLSFLLFTQLNHQEYYIIKILILLANIPIAFVYMRIVAETW
jgi:hypothetical protein